LKVKSKLGISGVNSFHLPFPIPFYNFFFFLPTRDCRFAAMESCPNEILHSICALLAPQDVAALRLVSKDIAAIASYYLVKSVRFHGVTESIDRLVQLAHHPSFCRRTTKLTWESTIMRPRVSYEDFNTIMQHDYEKSLDPKPIKPEDGASPREVRLYNRNLTKWQKKPQRIPIQQVKRQFSLYRKARDAEHTADMTLLLTKTLEDVFRRLPRLEEVSYDNVVKCQHMFSQRFVERFKDFTITPPFSTDTAPSVWHVAELLTALYRAETKLKVLHLRQLAPSFFDPAPIASPPTSYVSLKGLRELNIRFLLDDDHDHLPGLGCFGILKKGGLHQMLAAAPQLQTLAVNFDDDPQEPVAGIGDVLGSTSWPYLKTLSFSHLSCSEDGFMECLQRQKSLKLVDLGFMTMDKGSWEKTITRMKHDLSLTCVDFWGLLIGIDPECEDVWDMAAMDGDDYRSLISEDSSFESMLPMTLSMMIDLYVTSDDEDFPDPFWSHDWVSDFM
jgi:hypothetical protein